MPRAPTILQAEYPYSITARCINREWFKLPMETVWKIFCEQLAEVSEDRDLKVHSFVLMSNHFHLIASTPQANVSQCMQQFMQKSSLRLARSGNRINESFAGRYYKCILQCHNYYLNAYKYNYRNPVTANICLNVEDYPYSTLQMVMGVAPMTIPIIQDTTYEFDPKGTLNWLNTAPDPRKYEAAKRGFKYQFFKSSVCRSTRKPILPVNEIL